jgi:pre-mRNA-splicing factor ATP-dependent RNA helicase DHX38/PRP16
MKEEQMEQRKQKRMSAKQAQRNKDNALWEKNRMFRSGAVLRTDFDEDFEEISEAKVHLVSSQILAFHLKSILMIAMNLTYYVPFLTIL